MMNQETQSSSTGTESGSTQEIRDELCRIIDLLGNDRAEMTPQLRARFTELWDRIARREDETLH
jgi:hypothetical protein